MREKKKSNELRKYFEEITDACDAIIVGRQFVKQEKYETMKKCLK